MRSEKSPRNAAVVLDQPTNPPKVIPDSSLNSSQNPVDGDSDPSLPRFILVKNLPMNVAEADVRKLFSKLSSVSEVTILGNSTNVYLRVLDAEEAALFLAKKASSPMSFKGKKLEVCLVSKLPLDLNETSAIVLATIYKETIEINVKNLHGVFAEFGTLRKMIIFKKKNYQVFVEFASAEEAQFFRGALNNVNYKGVFFLKIQFTRKKELVVSGNNFYEFDFGAAQKGELEKVFGLPLVPPSFKDPLREPRNPAAPKAFPKLGFPDRNGVQVDSRVISSEGIPWSIHDSVFKPKIDVPVIPKIPKVTAPDNVHKAIPSQNGLAQSLWPNLRMVSAAPVSSDPFSSGHSVLPPRRIQTPSLPRTYDILISFFNVSLKSRHLFNLLSLYGDVSRISVNSHRLMAIVSFRVNQHRLNALDSLSSPGVFDGHLVVEALDHPLPGFILADKKTAAVSRKTQDIFYTEQFTGFVQPWRPTVQSVPFFCPSHCLRVDGLPPQFPLRLLTNIFATIGEVTGIEENEEGETGNVFLFRSSFDATNVLCHFNYLELFGDVLDITFFHSKNSRPKFVLPEVTFTSSFVNPTPNVLQRDQSSTSVAKSGLLLGSSM